MSRSMQCALALALLLSLWLAPALALPAVADDCQNLLPPGEYTGTTSMNMVITAYEGDLILQRFTYGDTGSLALTLGCTVTDGSYHWSIVRTLMLYPGGPVVTCAYTIDLSDASGAVVTGANGLPRIDVRWAQAQVHASDCMDEGALPASTWHFSLAAAPQDRTIGGAYTFDFDGGDIQNYEEIAALFRGQGFDVTLGTSWTLTRAPQPTVQGLTAALRRYFLAGIPVTNRYTAAIDWDNSDPGTASFIVGSSPPRPMTVAGNTATVDLPLASIQGTGDFPLSVEATLEGRVDRVDNLGPLTLVPVPAWAAVFNLQPLIETDHVRYRGELAVPPQPLDAHVTLPAILPYVGGTWGLLPTQLRLLLQANSLGTRETGGLAAQGGFGLGKHTYTLSAQGKIYGTITHDALVFESEQLALSTPPITFREHLGLLSVIPGASALFGLPVIGSVLQGLDSALGVTAEVHGAMTGRGRLGIVGDSLRLTEGSFDATLGVLAAGGIDTPFVWATVMGGGDGSLSMRFIPATELIACRVLLSFQARAGALGYSLVHVAKQWPVYNCTTRSGATVLVSAAPADSVLRMVYGSPTAALMEQTLTSVQTTNGLTETVLAANASVQAQPLLTAGPDHRLALVWNSVSGSGAADAVTLRIFDGTTWRAPSVVSQANHPAFMPSAAFAGDGSLVVVWAEAQAAPEPSGLSADFASSLEIAWAKVNPATGQVTQRGLVTGDSVMDFAPRLRTAADGVVWLIWQRSTSADMAGTTAAPNRWRAALWTGSGWSTVETAGQNGVGTLFWDFAAVDAQHVWLAADVDTDGDMTTATDREIFLYKRTGSGWAAPLRLTNDAVVDAGPLVAATATGAPVVAWRHGEGVQGLTGDPAQNTPQTWIDAGAAVGPGFGGGKLLVGADGSRALFWPDGTAQGQDVWLTRFNPVAQSWTQPAPLFERAEQRRSLSAVQFPDGDIALGLAAADMVTATVTFDGGGVTDVPAVDDPARLIVAEIPAGYTPATGAGPLFLPIVTR